MAVKVGGLVIHRNRTVVTQTFWYTDCQYLNHGNKTANINVKKLQFIYKL